MEEKIAIAAVSAFIGAGTSLLTSYLSATWIKRLEHKRHLVELRITALKELNYKIAMSYKIMSSHIQKVKFHFELLHLRYSEKDLNEFFKNWANTKEEFTTFLFKEMYIMPEPIYMKSEIFIDTLNNANLFIGTLFLKNAINHGSEAIKRVIEDATQYIDKANRLKSEIFYESKKYGDWDILDKKTHLNLFHPLRFNIWRLQNFFLKLRIKIKNLIDSRKRG